MFDKTKPRARHYLTSVVLVHPSRPVGRFLLLATLAAVEVTYGPGSVRSLRSGVWLSTRKLKPNLHGFEHTKPARRMKKRAPLWDRSESGGEEAERQEGGLSEWRAMITWPGADEPLLLIQRCTRLVSESKILRPWRGEPVQRALHLLFRIGQSRKFDVCHPAGDFQWSRCSVQTVTVLRSSSTAANRTEPGDPVTAMPNAAPGAPASI